MILESSAVYQLQQDDDVTFSIRGQPVALPKQVVLTSGWNAIAYPFLESTPLAQMDMTGLPTPLSGGGFSTGDLIKSQFDHSMFYSGWGWYGTLKTLRPGEGYRLKLGANSQGLYEWRSLSSSRESQDAKKEVRQAVTKALQPEHE